MNLGIILCTLMGILITGSCTYYLIFEGKDFKGERVPTWKSWLGLALGIAFLMPSVLYFIGVE